MAVEDSPMQRSSSPAASRGAFVVALLVVAPLVALARTPDPGTRPSHARAAVAVSFDPIKVTLLARTSHCAIAASAPPVQANVVCG
jgi:hypothetical protein